MPIDKDYAKISFIVFFLIIVVLSLVIVWPFVTIILAGFVISYIFFPIYNKMRQYVKSETLAAILISILVVAIFTLPVMLTINALYKDMAKVLIISKQKLSTTFFATECMEDTVACDVTNYINSVIEDPKVKDAIYASLSKFTFSFMNSLPGLIASIPKLILNLFILIFVMFYFFKDGRKIEKEIRELLPFKQSFIDKLVKRTKDILHATVYGAIIVAIVQGILGTIGFIIFHSTESPYLWGALLAFAALIPIVGSALVWLPIGVIQIITGIAMNETVVIWKGVGLLLYGTFLISTIDNLIKPKIIGRRSDLHPVLVLLGILGGLMVLGFIGIIIGPLILALLMSFIEVYKEVKHEIIA
ncbi:AI-2E family transporter [Candidatus Woesearchaeota archaeon]|nr:AI-2E family transporter [Candidatus Woesearchaeota archaeon]